MSADPRVAALRAELERAFAAPRRDSSSRETHEELLLLRAGAQALAVRSREVLGVEARRKVVKLPGADERLLGLAALRGKLTAVYGLARLLGASEREDEARWLLSCEGGVALAFTGFEGMSRVPRESIGELIRVEGALRRVLSLPTLLEQIRGETT